MASFPSNQQKQQQLDQQQQRQMPHPLPLPMQTPVVYSQQQRPGSAYQPTQPTPIPSIGNGTSSNVGGGGVGSYTTTTQPILPHRVVSRPSSANISVAQMQNLSRPSSANISVAHMQNLSRPSSANISVAHMQKSRNPYINPISPSRTSSIIPPLANDLNAAMGSSTSTNPRTSQNTLGTMPRKSIIPPAHDLNAAMAAMRMRSTCDRNLVPGTGIVGSLPSAVPNGWRPTTPGSSLHPQQPRPQSAQQQSQQNMQLPSQLMALSSSQQRGNPNLDGSSAPNGWKPATTASSLHPPQQQLQQPQSMPQSSSQPNNLNANVNNSRYRMPGFVAQPQQQYQSQPTPIRNTASYNNTAPPSIGTTTSYQNTINHRLSTNTSGMTVSSSNHLPTTTTTGITNTIPNKMLSGFIHNNDEPKWKPPPGIMSTSPLTIVSLDKTSELSQQQQIDASLPIAGGTTAHNTAVPSLRMPLLNQSSSHIMAQQQQQQQQYQQQQQHQQQVGGVQWAPPPQRLQMASSSAAYTTATRKMFGNTINGGDNFSQFQKQTPMQQQTHQQQQLGETLAPHSGTDVQNSFVATAGDIMPEDSDDADSDDSDDSDDESGNGDMNPELMQHISQHLNNLGLKSPIQQAQEEQQQSMNSNTAQTLEVPHLHSATSPNANSCSSRNSNYSDNRARSKVSDDTFVNLNVLLNKLRTKKITSPPKQPDALSFSSTTDTEDDSIDDYDLCPQTEEQLTAFIDSINKKKNQEELGVSQPKLELDDGNQLDAIMVEARRDISPLQASLASIRGNDGFVVKSPTDNRPLVSPSWPSPRLSGSNISQTWVSLKFSGSNISKVGSNISKVESSHDQFRGGRSPLLLAKDGMLVRSPISSRFSTHAISPRSLRSPPLSPNEIQKSPNEISPELQNTSHGNSSLGMPRLPMSPLSPMSKISLRSPMSATSQMSSKILLGDSPLRVLQSRSRLRKSMNASSSSQILGGKSMDGTAEVHSSHIQRIINLANDADLTEIFKCLMEKSSMTTIKEIVNGTIEEMTSMDNDKVSQSKSGSQMLGVNNGIPDGSRIMVSSKTTAAERAKVLDSYMQRIVELANKGDSLMINDVKDIAADARSDGLEDADITEIFKSLEEWKNIKGIVDSAIEEMTAEAEQAKVPNPYMQRIFELATKGDNLIINDVKGIAVDARNDGLDSEIITEIFKCLMERSSKGDIEDVVNTAIEEMTTAAEQAKQLAPYMPRILELANKEDDLTTNDVKSIAVDARNDGLNDAGISEMFKCLMEKSCMKTIKALVDSVIEEIDADCEAVVVLQQQKDDWMAFCMSEAMDLARSDDPSIEEMEFLIRDAKDGDISVLAIIRAFDEGRGDLTFGENIASIQDPDSSLNNHASDEGCIDITTGKNSVNNQDPASHINKILKLNAYMREAIELENNGESTQEDIELLLDKVRVDGIDPTVIQEVLDAPIFVTDEDDVKDGELSHEKKVEMIIALKNASILARKDGLWEEDLKNLLESAGKKGLPIREIKDAFVVEKENLVQEESHKYMGITNKDKYGMSEEESLSRSNVQFLPDIPQISSTKISMTDNDEVEIDFLHGFVKREHAQVTQTISGKEDVTNWYRKSGFEPTNPVLKEANEEAACIENIKVPTTLCDKNAPIKDNKKMTPWLSRFSKKEKKCASIAIVEAESVDTMKSRVIVTADCESIGNADSETAGTVKSNRSKDTAESNKSNTSKSVSQDAGKSAFINIAKSKSKDSAKSESKFTFKTEKIEEVVSIDAASLESSFDEKSMAGTNTKCYINEENIVSASMDDDKGNESSVSVDGANMHSARKVDNEPKQTAARSKQGSKAPKLNGISSSQVSTVHEKNNSKSRKFDEDHQYSRQKMKQEINHTFSGDKVSDENIPEINGVSAVAALKTRRRFRRHNGVRLPSGIQHQWRLPLAKRIAGHGGYKDITVQSIHETAIVYGEPHKLDSVPWERRCVLPHFLNEKRIDIAQKWFGRISSERMNNKARDPIIHPKCVEMDIEYNPLLDAWDEAWYTTWRSRKDNPNNFKSVQSSFSDSDSQRSISLQIHEIGTICTMRYRIGERVSRVHPQYTSSLRKSRWKKKYFPKGIFMGMS